MKKYLIAIFFTLAIVSFSLNASASDQAPQLTAEEILNKHFEAAGGKQKLMSFKSRVALGTVKKEAELEANFAIASDSKRVGAVYAFQRYSWNFGYNGSDYFMRPNFPRGVNLVQSKYGDMLASGLMFNSISLYSLLLNPPEDAKFTAKGTKKVNDRPAYIVEVKRKSGPVMKLYFDTQNFMWLRTDYGRLEITKPQGAFTNEIVPHGEDDNIIDFYFETWDFRDVEGVKLPFKFKQVVTYPILQQSTVGTITGTITEYQHNVDLDPRFFH
ncbi:MAG: hypothetical protein AUG51_14940 [Acidobacteria bacterium 13_1_20CM_3_53_8]|nr:MAG: hypothetical protein AUG51_14940 [Acidobacteria bacterium 13_1_20CM_3_53_8]